MFLHHLAGVYFHVACGLFLNSLFMKYLASVFQLWIFIVKSVNASLHCKNNLYKVIIVNAYLI